MRRVESEPRNNWQKLVEDEGLMWHDVALDDGSGKGRYWDESAYYEFTMTEVDAIEAATNELHQMCLKAAQEVIDTKIYDRFGIPPGMVPLIEKAWEEEPPSLYGRFDLAIPAEGGIKMLEYNADTPTALLEAAVCQWSWFEQTKKGSDQFNSIHDKLIDTWKYFSDWIGQGKISFTSADSVEDGFTLAYLQETASRAGYATESFPMLELGWDGQEFVSGNSKEYLQFVFKLYPWEWMAHEKFAAFLPNSRIVWIEPVWKMLLSNKAILPVLWKLFPGHPYLLEATHMPPADPSGWVRKPIMGREGANVTMFGQAKTGGDYGEEGFIYQRNANLVPQDGNYAVIGSWIIGQEAAGVGIRESDGPITGNLSRFVPHVIV